MLTFSAETKYMLPYEAKTVSTSFGDVRVKVARFQGDIITIAPEYEDCRQQAEAHGLPIKRVYEQIKYEAKKILEDHEDHK